MRLPGFSQLRRYAGIDFHVAVTLLFRSWSIIAGGVMVIFVPVWFTAVEQGYYYTFASLIGLQVFFELGINQVVVQLVGHEMAHLDAPPAGGLRGPREHVERLTSLVRLLRRWYLIASSGFFVTVSIAGLIFFQRRGGLPPVEWLGGWVLLVAFSSINLYFSPMLAVLEGCGRVGQVARLRLLQSMVGYLLLWLALSLRWGLWAIPLVSGAAAACTAWWTLSSESFLSNFRHGLEVAPKNVVTWRTEIFPFQWRVALSWISGYFILQLFTPTTFAHHGPTEAGRLGIALSIFSALLTVGMSWVNTKVPIFAGHISRGERRDLNRVFVGALLRSVGFTIAATAAFVGVVFFVSLYRPELVARIAPLPVLASLAIASAVNAFIFGAAGYMRAHREEPMLTQSIAVAALVVLSTYATANISVAAMMFAYAAITTFISLPWTLWLLKKYYRRLS